MPGLTEATQTVKREDLADMLTIVDAKNLPFTSMCPKGKMPKNTTFEWPVDMYENPSFGGVNDGKDVDEYENHATNRDKLSGRIQHFRRTIKVTRLTEVNDVAGVGTGQAEFNKAKAKKMVEIKRDIESALCSDNDSQQEGAAGPYKTRGLGSWISNSAQSDLPVPADYRTPTGSINSTATASLTETQINDVFQSVYEETGQVSKFALICGPTLKRRFSDMARLESSSGADLAAIRRFNQPDVNKIINNVDMYEGDFGKVALHPTQWLARISDATTYGTAQKGRGYVLDWRYVEMKYHTQPTFKDLPDMGGGERGLIEAIIGLCVKSPLALGKFNPS